MIPTHLKLSGFLSYRDPIEVDFRAFDLACISGQNGAGKSSLLDAITWALFGVARKRDEALINNASESAKVIFNFEYENNLYQVQRTLTRGKPGVLEFQIFDGERYRVLSGESNRATQAQIESTLHLDYETFINASFFLQGKADQFTQQRPADRKRILSSILGLDTWEVYREKTVAKRRLLEGQLAATDGRISEINEELAQETVRTARLKELEADLKSLTDARKTQELALASIRQAHQTLKLEQEMVARLEGQVRVGNAKLNEMLERWTKRTAEREKLREVVANAAEIEAAQREWQSQRLELEKMDGLARRVHDLEKASQVPLNSLNAEQARLEQAREGLEQNQAALGQRLEHLKEMEEEQENITAELAELEKQLKARAKLEESQAIAARFREQARLRDAPLAEINNETTRLETEVKNLEKTQAGIETQRSGLTKLEADLAVEEQKLAETKTQLEQRRELETRLQALKDENLLLKNNNLRLKTEMEVLQERIESLEKAEGADCPLCGQPLSPDERTTLLESLQQEGQEKASVYRKNRQTQQELEKESAELEKMISASSRLEQTHLFQFGNVEAIKERLAANQKIISAWEEGDALQLAQSREILKSGKYCLAARQNLFRIERELEAIGKALGVRPALEDSIFVRVEEKVGEIESEMAHFKDLDEERIQQTTRAARVREQILALQAARDEWERNSAPRLAEISQILETGSFALTERQTLAGLNREINGLGYQPEVHEALRQAEALGRTSEKRMRELETARAALQPLEREITELESQKGGLQAEMTELELSLEQEVEKLAGMSASTPGLKGAEDALLEAQERENILRREVGGAQQKVRVLADLRQRKAGLEQEREELALQIRNHRTLERAFGKDGVPALLIEQALPQIEDKANELLDRLSNGSMSIRFITQAGYKDKNRDDLRETLDIQISDGAGTRDYEMFSGGEAFRVNFAIRLALSETLAQRSNARLQTLVIDEGFGSQDTQGRQRLIEAINQVRKDFKKILIITHLEELKDAFPNRIEVEKTERGSSVSVF